MKSRKYGYFACHNGPVSVPVLDEAMLQTINPLLSDIRILNDLIKKIAPDKSAELFKIMQHPEQVLARMNNLDKSLLIKMLIENITVNYDSLEIKWTSLALGILPYQYLPKTNDGIMSITAPLSRTRGALQVNVPESLVASVCPNKELINALGKAFKYQKMIASDKISITDLARQEEKDAAFMGRVIRLTSLAPDIITSVLKGTQPPTFILQNLMREDIPPIWAEQRKKYSFPEI